MHEMFSNTHDLTINGGNYYNGDTFIQYASSQGKYFLQHFVAYGRSSLLIEFTESGQGIVPGIRVVGFDCPSSFATQS